MNNQYYQKRIEELKKQNLLTDAVKIFLTGMLAADGDLTLEEKILLRNKIDFDMDKYGAVGEAAIFGDVVDFLGKRIDFRKEELIKKSAD